MGTPDEEQVSDVMVKGYIIWYRADGTCHDYPSYPVMEWYPDGKGNISGGWSAALMEGHAYAKELEALASWAGYMRAEYTTTFPNEFSEYFTFPKSWMEGVEDVRYKPE